MVVVVVVVVVVVMVVVVVVVEAGAVIFCGIDAVLFACGAYGDVVPFPPAPPPPLVARSRRCPA